MTHNVADAFNLHERGKIETGRIGDITIIDLKKEWVVDSSKMQSKCKWSPFENWKLKGKAEIVIRKGEIIYQEGEFI
jgi:dihydroorotase